MSEQNDMAAERHLTALAAEIAGAYVSHNALSAGDLPKLIADVHCALVALGSPAPEPEKTPAPAVPIRRSVTPDYIVCLEDGLKFKSLKRHLSTKFGMSPEAYRTKWGLPRDYPMVAPNYAAVRSSLAKSAGLGRKPKAEKKRGRKRVA